MFSYLFGPQLQQCPIDADKSIFGAAFLVHRNVCGYKQGTVVTARQGPFENFLEPVVADNEVVIQDMKRALRPVAPHLLCAYYLYRVLRPELVDKYMYLDLQPGLINYELQSYVNMSTESRYGALVLAYSIVDGVHYAVYSKLNDPVNDMDYSLNLYIKVGQMGEEILLSKGVMAPTCAAFNLSLIHI